MKHKYILILLGLAILASALLTFANVASICGGDSSGCLTVKNSEYAHLFGVSTSLIGLIAFASLFVITFLDKKKKTKLTHNLLKTGLIIGAAFAVFFIYLQFFSIHAICKYCMVSDTSIIFASIIFFLPGDK